MPFVYVIQEGNNSLYKIGYTTNLDYRLKRLKQADNDTLAPQKLDRSNLHYVGVIECLDLEIAKSLETYLHGFYFKSNYDTTRHSTFGYTYQQDTEWFELTESQVGEIAGLAKGRIDVFDTKKYEDWGQVHDSDKSLLTAIAARRILVYAS